MDKRLRRPRLDRRNAVKNIDYEIESPSDLRATRSLDLSAAYTSQTTFRIGGAGGGTAVDELDLLCRALGLSGPEDFSISADAWAASKIRSSSRRLPTSKSSALPPSTAEVRVRDDDDLRESLLRRSLNEDVRGIRVRDDSGDRGSFNKDDDDGHGGAVSVSAEIRGLDDSAVRRSFNKGDDNGDAVCDRAEIRVHKDSGDLRGSLVRGSFNKDDGGGGGGGGGEEDLRVAECPVDLSSGSCSCSTRDDDSSSTTTEPNVSPIDRFRRSISSWMRGGLLGSGSFGTVYEGISDDGFFFAVKEVSLADQGSNAQQCILQLEQEVVLLSQFEHENIVQYYGTEKEETKLFIFLELVTQGSLASLYQRYHLQDSQVSAYTRQILHGLSYLHDRNVVHRDIKCANILVHANGSVKLADFGLAKEITKLNMLKSCKGSVYWMAPEVVNPRRPYGPSADIWSLGCTVLEMLTRQIPYPNLEWPQALFKIGRGGGPSIPENLSTDAQDFIRQCVQVNPEGRPSASLLLEHPFVRRSLPARSDSSSHGSS